MDQIGARPAAILSTVAIKRVIDSRPQLGDGDDDEGHWARYRKARSRARAVANARFDPSAFRCFRLYTLPKDLSFISRPPRCIMIAIVAAIPFRSLTAPSMSVCRRMINDPTGSAPTHPGGIMTKAQLRAIFCGLLPDGLDLRMLTPTGREEFRRAEIWRQ